MVKSITIVVPVYNEEAGLRAFIARLRAVMVRQDIDWRVLFVDDGSRDGTLELIRAQNRIDERFSALALSRNFGKETAVAAGLKHATGDAVILMDGDTEHPPEVLPDFIAAWRAGHKVVLGQRQPSGREGVLRKLASKMFYRVFQLMSDLRLASGAVDFLLLDRMAVDAMNGLQERTRFNKGLYAWIGFSTATIPFVVGDRTAGSSRWKLTQLIRFAMDGVFAFSATPLKASSYLGFTVSAIALAYAAVVAVRTLVFGADVPGYPTLVVSISFFAGAQLISLGILGEYVARIYEEVKGRPLFLVEEKIGLDGDPISSPRASPSKIPQAQPALALVEPLQMGVG